MLIVLRVRVVGSDVGRDVVVDLDDEHRVAELTAALADHLGLDGVWHVVSERTGRAVDPETPVSRASLVHGDGVWLCRSPGDALRAHHVPAVAIALDAVGGTEAGRSWHLVAGRYEVGSGGACDIVVHDPTVDRHHLSVSVDPACEAVEVTPTGAAPVTVGGEPIEGPLIVGPDDVVEVGRTRLVLRPVRRGETTRPERRGQVQFQRTPYRPPVVADRTVGSLGPVPRRPEPRRFQILSVLAPLAAGIVMYAFSRQVQFLALTLVSPIVMIGNAVDDRRSGRRAQRTAVVDFHDCVVEHRQSVLSALADERAERWRAAPDVALLARRARERSVDLWERGRPAPDFLRLRVGLGTLPSGTTSVIESGGDDGLRAEAIEALRGLDHVAGVPVVLDLGSEVVAAVAGPADLVDGVVASLLVQAACLHGPDDLVVVVAVPSERAIAWTKWLPHTRSVTSPVAGRHVARTAKDADRLIADLLAVASFRREHDVRWPRVLAVIDPAVGADSPSLSHLLDVASEVGIRVLWVSARAADVPRQAVSVLTCDPGHGGRGVLWTTDPDAGDAVDVELEPIRLDVAERIARDLAPLRDVSTAAAGGSIPRVVDLLDCVGHESTVPARLVERWLTPAPFGLRFPIGMGAAGPVELDLVHDGPHALVAGTSGAGKSELLQTLVASLATRYSPERLTFLFVDYKGGAASSTFAALPHTVGYVTNLGADLAMRALTSLRAELNHRMAMMEGRAKDLEEMTALFPHEAPPALVIIVDEFATLVKEIPEFVAGIVDIAQRGRSLGIHLVLATQRPSGAVNENILANTNLRISLRMLERSESTAIIGTPDAADIPVPLRGRAIVRLGGQQLVPVQCGYGGAPVASDRAERPVLVGDFDEPGAVPTATTVAARASAPSATADDAADQLAAVVGAVAVAHERLGATAPRRPWHDPLPDHVGLAPLITDERTAAARRHPGRHVVIGSVDAPERQEQHPLVVDLEEGGGLLVFGSGGAGKTTVLRTIAAAIEATAQPGTVDVLALDLTSRGLAGLRELACVVDVATADDVEAVTRHIVVLEREIERRRGLLGSARAEHLTAYHALGGRLSRVVLLIDGFGALADALGEGGAAGLGFADAWVERLVRVIVDGRQVGVHAVITADRRSAVPSRLHAAVGPRLVLRHAEATSYAEHGIRGSAGASLEAGNGRGLWRGDSLVQVACVSDDPAAGAQSEALERLARHADHRVRSALASEALPESLRALPGRGVDPALVVPIGLTDVTGEVAMLDLLWSHAVVAGGPRSGRSTALASIGATLAGGHDVYRLGPAGCGLATSAGCASARAGFGAAAATVLIERIENLCALGSPLRPIVILVDDADRLDDHGLARAWERLLGVDSVRIVAAMETRALTGFTTDPLIGAMKRARRQLILQPDDPAEFVQMTGVKLPRRPGLAWPAGRGVLVADRTPRVVHVVAAPATDLVADEPHPVAVPLTV